MTNGNDLAYQTGNYREDPNEIQGFPNHGLTKREYFAAMAMQGIASKQGGLNTYDWDFIAEHAVKSADALITSLNKNQLQ